MIHPGPFFFIHVMKTAGMTFNRHIDANFPPEEIYPGTDDATGIDYWVIARLRQAIAERGDVVRLWRGHFPFFVSDLVAGATTLTLLREPVARTISLLEQRRVLEFPDTDIETLYDDRQRYRREIENHQTKIFSLTEDDDPSHYLKVIESDRARLEAAKRRLDSVDVLGVQEHFDTFLATLENDWGWKITDIENTNVGVPPTTSAAFRQRIADDNALDVELYDHALELVMARSR